MTASIVPIVIEQHAEELATLWTMRNTLRSAGHVVLKHLRRFDDRIAAHQDGCLVAGDDGLRVLSFQLDPATSGRVFALAVVALESNEGRIIDQCLALTEARREVSDGMTSALGWVSSTRLRGIAKDMLTSSSPTRRALGLAACRVHGANPGSSLDIALKESNPAVRAEALRSVGVLGDVHRRSALVAATDEDPACQFWAAWSATLLGARGRVLDTLSTIALSESNQSHRACRLVCQALPLEDGHAMLKRMSADTERIRWVIEGSGIVGDPAYVPWLIKQMATDKLARLAGEAFTLITGADIAFLDLERQVPGQSDSAPTDDAADARVDMDPDDGLPWPDPVRVQAWWRANEHRLTRATRSFMGAPPTPQHCRAVLKNGSQRQRSLAASYLCLLEPSTPLFNTNAPAWRQQAALCS